MTLPIAIKNHLEQFPGVWSNLPWTCLVCDQNNDGTRVQCAKTTCPEDKGSRAHALKGTLPWSEKNWYIKDMDPLSKANVVKKSAEDFFSFKSASEAEILVIVGCLETSTWPEFGWLKTSMTRIELSSSVNMTKIWMSRNVNMTRIWMFTEVNRTKIGCLQTSIWPQFDWSQ